MEFFMLKSGTTMVHGPYKGSAPMTTDFLSGEIHMARDALSTSGAMIKSGKLRALGIDAGAHCITVPGLVTGVNRMNEGKRSEAKARGFF